MTTREELVDGFRMSIREGLRTTRDFSPQDWKQVVHDDEGGWTRKQVYSHLTSTAELTPGLIGALANAAEDQDAGAGLDIGAFNAQQVAAREDMGTEDLMQKFEDSYRNLIDFVQGMPEDQLTLKRRFGALEATVADMMASLLVLHSLSHIYLASTRAFV